VVCLCSKVGVVGVVGGGVFVCFVKVVLGVFLVWLWFCGVFLESCGGNTFNSILLTLITQ